MYVVCGQGIIDYTPCLHGTACTDVIYGVPIGYNMTPTYTSLAEIAVEYAHVYLSPHLDDAILSCGGAIAAQINAGERVLVVTLCTAIPTREQLGPLAEEFHGDWNLTAEDAVTARLHEDTQAMQIVAADYLWAGMLDSIYRMPLGYDTRERLFGTPRPEDPLFDALRPLFEQLHERLPNARFYAPLAIGYHVDHQITYEVASDVFGGQLWFYEDVYYVLIPGELERRKDQLGIPFAAYTIDISTTIERKIAAINAYASQVPELFGGSEPMAEAIRGYAGLVGPMLGERVWKRNM
jgi:LmbE family N-acetylglucosaminyl deacetylase